jgi:hypothetical protein
MSAVGRDQKGGGRAISEDCSTVSKDAIHMTKMASGITSSMMKKNSKMVIELQEWGANGL